MPPSSGQNVIVGLMQMAATLFFIGIVLYFYFGVTLMVIARKTGTRSAGLAWLPIGNLFLMCSIGRRPGWWVLLLLVPFVNIIVAAMIWMSMAEARGKPSWTGALALIPVVGLLVPAYLALGPATHPDAGAGPRACPSCGAVDSGAEAFCGECGGALPPRAAVGRTPAGQMALAAAVIVIVLTVVIGGSTQMILQRMLAYTAPQRKAPALPARLAGTLKEFPVDTNGGGSFRPTTVVTQQFAAASPASRSTAPTLGPRSSGRSSSSRGSSSSRSAQVSSKWLPAGLPPSSIQSRASSIASAVYRGNASAPRSTPAGAGAPPSSADATDSIYVHVIDPSEGSAGSAQSMVSSIQKANSGTVNGISVQSPSGGAYRGARVRSSQDVTFVLQGGSAGRIIVIYAPRPGLEDAATRLARNIGNGEGLADDPQVKGSLWTLPAELPAGLTLQETSTVTPEDLGLSDSNLQSASRSEAGKDVHGAIDQLRQLLPGRFTTARYTDRSGRDWQMTFAEYPAPTRAWTTWMMLRMAMGTARPSKIGTEDGLFQESQDGNAVFFQKGPYLGGILGPPGASAEELGKLGGAMQL